MELTKVIELVQSAEIDNLDLQFHAAVEAIDIVKLRVKEQGEKLGTNDLLSLYAPYKQAMAGDNNTAKPSLFAYLNPIDYAVALGKWNAWSEMKGTKQDVAKRQYIQAAIDMARKYTDLVEGVDFSDETLIEKREDLGIEKEDEPTALDDLAKEGDKLSKQSTVKENTPPTMLNQYQPNNTAEPKMDGPCKADKAEPSPIASKKLKT